MVEKCNINSIRNILDGTENSLLDCHQIRSLRALLFNVAELGIENTEQIIHRHTGSGKFSMVLNKLFAAKRERRQVYKSNPKSFLLVSDLSNSIDSYKTNTRNCNDGDLEVKLIGESQAFPSPPIISPPTVKVAKGISIGTNTDFKRQKSSVGTQTTSSFPPILKDVSSRSTNQLKRQLEPGSPGLAPKKLMQFQSAREILNSDTTKKNSSKTMMLPGGSMPSGMKRLPLIQNIQPPKAKAVGNPVDERLKNVDKAMIEFITNEIQTNVSVVTWDDIAGLHHAKKSIMEMVVWPMTRPDIFHGIRAPPKGLLLFGPPGTGKTLIGKCIASQVKATFFSISSSSLTSKWIGDGEKMVRALFAVARVRQPSVIFVDEVDSLLSQRNESEHEASRRLKTEFLVQFDGCGTATEDRILLIGATNRPGEIDEAARRRFRKKLYIPLPEADARKAIIKSLLNGQSVKLSEQELDDITQRTAGYSGSDVDGLVREASLGPLREIIDLSKVDVNSVRPIGHEDFLAALQQVKASVTSLDLQFYLKFDKEFGAGGSLKTG